MLQIFKIFCIKAWVIAMDALTSDIMRDSAGEVGPPVPVFRGGTGLRPDVDLSSNRALLEGLDDARSLCSEHEIEHEQRDRDDDDIGLEEQP